MKSSAFLVLLQKTLLVIPCFSMVLFSHLLQAEPQVLSLAGNWQMRLEDPRKGEAGMSNKWFDGLLVGTAAILPGTLQVENRCTVAAVKPDIKPESDAGLSGFTPLYNYRGVTWYQREVEIPAKWVGKHIEMSLERCMWESYVWVDGAFQGSCNSLAAPHLYDLSKVMAPGRHRITIAVDNTNSAQSMSGTGVSHSLKGDEDVNNTMSKFFNQFDQPDGPIKKNNDTKYGIAGHQLWSSCWTGIIGRLELRASDSVRIASANAYPMVDQGSVRLKLLIENGAQVAKTVSVEVTCGPRNDNKSAVTAKWELKLAPVKRQTIEQVVKLAEPLQLWNEDTPNLYDAVIAIKLGGMDVLDTRTIRFGMRELGRKDNQFTVNGRTVFLRGEQDSLIFPLTVSPPMDVGSWRKIMSAMKNHGFNHLRFHTCCPPDAAFEAADETGIFMQVETPMVNTSEGSMTLADPTTTEFVSQELRRILDAYGNHPSLFAVAMGNEQGNKLVDFRVSLVKFGKEYDPRHFYSETAGTQARDPKFPLRGSASDFFVTAHPISGTEPLCGIAWGGGNVLTASRFNTRAPETVFDYSVSLQGLDKPLLTHEVGQWAVYPDLSEIPKYNGAQRAFNFELIRDRLEAKDMLKFAPGFTRASGMLALALYKEEIESALRTPGLAGFQLLQMHDYPGQGTATVGLLNSLWESKGLVTPEEFRSFCSPVTPLARIPKRIWMRNETLAARVDLANYGSGEVAGPIQWSLTGQGGRKIASGNFEQFKAPAGKLTTVGQIAVPLSMITSPEKLVLSVDAGVSKQLPNHWDIWVYPEAVPIDIPSGVNMTTAWDDRTKSLLHQGRKVLLVVDPNGLPLAINSKPSKAENFKSRAGTFDMPIPGNFTPVFWTMMMKKGQLAQTMGLQCDPSNPALAKFPTEFHSNWQWWDPVIHSAVMQIDGLPKALLPIVRVVDNFRYNQRLAMIFEVKLGSGSLLVCSSDIVNDLEKRPVARQLRRSLLDYMASPAFQPQVSVSENELENVLLRKPAPVR